MFRRTSSALGLAGAIAVALHAGGAQGQPRPAEVGRPFPFLADESSVGSRSVGDTSDGVLVNGRRLTESDALGILPKQRERGCQYGTDELVSALEEASRALFAATKTRLWVGNLSREGGGDISWSVSHNSGRDADVAFAYRDRSGKPVDPPDLLRVNGAGHAEGLGYRFDAARTWIVVKSLLESRHAWVQYLFISAPLRQQLLTHARRSGEMPVLVEKASEVLRQPVGSAPHDDHLHVRTYCTERDVLAGCRDSGILHPWHAPHDDAKANRIRTVRGFLRHDDPEQRRRAIERLVLLEATSTLDAIVTALHDSNAGVRKAAVEAIAAMGTEAHVPSLAQHWKRERDPATVLAMFDAAARLGGPAAGEWLARAVGTPDRTPTELDRAIAAWRDLVLPAPLRLAPRLMVRPRPTGGSSGLHALFAPVLRSDDAWLGPGAADARVAISLQLGAIQAAARAERTEPAKPLVELLASPDATVRTAAARALAHITNHPRPVVEGTNQGLAPTALMDRWRRTVDKLGAAPRDGWLVAGFRTAGFRVPEIHPRHSWELVRAVAGDEASSSNAQRALMRLFDHRPRSLEWSRRDACTHWFRWLRAGRARLHLSSPPGGLESVCRRAPE